MTSAGSPTAAEALIRSRIDESGPISFAAFMELALYHPDVGYYTRPGMCTGRRGDFSTSSDVSPAFGRRIAIQAAEVWLRLGRGPWRLVELGPGRGLLAGDLIEGLRRFAPEAHAALEELVLVELSPSLRELQREHLGRVAPDVETRWVGALDELEEDEIRGFVVGNEFLDALPVHLVARRHGQIVARVVGLDGAGRLALLDGPAPEPAVVELAERYQLCPAEDDVAEVCAALGETMGDLGRVLAAGAVLFIDYGHDAPVLGDEDHADGTLVAYHEHRVELDLLKRPGLQDLTAHVNWTHVADAARSAGLTPEARTWQDRFLIALGLAEDLLAPDEPAAESLAERQERLAARALIMPGAGGGKRFEVVGFIRGIEGGLQGFSGFRTGVR